MKKYLIIGSLLTIFVILSIKYAVTNRVIEHSLKYGNVREYVHQMVFVNGVRTRTFSWEMLPIPIYLDLHSADIRSKIENTMRTIEHNIGVPLFLETNDFRQAKIFLVTSPTGQERLPEFLTRLINELLGPAMLELFQIKAPVLFDHKAYPQAPRHPCFTKEFFSDPSTQYDGDDRKPTEMLIFIGGVAEIENDILNECLIEELLHAAFFLRDADLTHGQHSIFNQTSHADRARVPTPFDLCLISELLNGTFNAKEHYKMANSIYFKLKDRECPVWREETQ